MEFEITLNNFFKFILSQAQLWIIYNMANYAALATQKNIDDDSIKSKFQNYLIDLHTAVRKITNLQVNMKRLHEKLINITQFCVLLTQLNTHAQSLLYYQSLGSVI